MVFQFDISALDDHIRVLCEDATDMDLFLFKKLHRSVGENQRKDEKQLTDGSVNCEFVKF